MDDRIGINYDINIAQIKAQAAKVKGIIAQLNQFIQSASQTVSESGGSAAGLSNTVQQLQKLGVTSNMTAKDIKNLNLSAADMQRVLTLTKKRMKELTKEVDSSGKVTKTAAAEYDHLSKRLPEVEHEVNRGIKAFGDYRRAMDRWGQGFKYMMLSQLAWIASGGALIAMIGGITKGISDIIQFHQQMKALLAITGANAQEMDMMEQAIRKAAVATKFFASDMGNAATIMAQAGFSAEEISNSIGAVAVLASSTGRDLKDVADLMTTIIRAYGMNASEALRVANVLAAGIAKSKLQIDTLTTALNYMGVASHQFGISLEDTVAWLGVLRDRGMKASTIGTSFRGVLATLVRETRRFSDVLKGLKTPLGFADVSLAGGQRLEVVMKKLADAGFRVSDAFASIPRRTAMTFSLMIKNVEAFEKLRKEITGTNSAIDMNRIMMQGLDSQLKQTKSILDEFLLAFSKSGGALEPFVAGIKGILQILGSFLAAFALGIKIISRGSTMFAAGPKSPNIEGKSPNLSTMSEAELRQYQENRAKLLQQQRSGFMAGRSGIIESGLKDMEKDINEFKTLMDRVWGKGGFLSFGGKSPEQQDAGQAAEQLRKLSIEYNHLIRQFHDPALERGSEAWKDLRDKIQLVSNQIDELKNSSKDAIGTLDDLYGPLVSLQDVLYDILFKQSAHPEEFLSIFRKGKDNIILLSEAVKHLRDQFYDAFAKFDEKGGAEQLKRMMQAAQELARAEDTLAKAQKKIEDEKQANYKKTLKALAAQVKFIEDARKRGEKAEKKEVDAAFKVFKMKQSLQREEIQNLKHHTNALESIDQRYSRGKKQLLDALADLNRDEYQRAIADIENEATRRREVLQQMLTDSKQLLAQMREDDLWSTMLGGKIGETEDRIASIEQLLQLVDQIEQKAKSQTFAPSDSIAGMVEGLKDFGKELRNEFKSWHDLVYNSATAMRDTMSDVFFDAMNSELKTAEEYWKSFTNSVKRYIADMAAKWLMFQAFGSMGSGDKPSWGLLGTAASYVFGASHAGGKGPGESMTVIRNDEFVMRGSSSRSIGYDNLERMNRTGTMPQGGPTVVDNSRTYLMIDAIDPQSFDRVLRERGGRAIMDMSLQSFSIASAKKDPRVRSR
uniref:Putative tail protein n=1 Tax=viral metagenome TaxID=1070528 RepID=A0A6H1ZHR1_9ZZZZ